MDENKKGLRFVAEHYKENKMDTDAAWRRLVARTGYAARSKRRMRSWTVAASVVIGMGIAVAGGIMIKNQQTSNDSGNISTPELIADSLTENYAETDTVKVFKYDNTPINVVMRELSEYYGHEMECDDTTKCVTGEIEASSLNDVVEILESTLNIEVKVK